MANLQQIAGVILAGGLGTRLRSVMPDRPKVLAEVGGRPFITYLLDQLAEAGLRRVVLCTGYRAEQVRGTLGDCYAGMHLAYSVESCPLGTGGALHLAYPLLRTDTVLVLNGDSCCRADLPAFAAWHSARGAEATLLLTRVEDARRYGRIQTDATGRVRSFQEKTSQPGPGWINAGIYLMDTELLSTIPADVSLSLEREVFPAWLQRRFYGYQSRGSFLDIGTPESFAQAASFLGTLERSSSRS